MQYGPVIAVEKSQDVKVGKVSATYAAMQSCPAACPLYDAGCYGQQGNVNLHAQRVAPFGEGLSPEQIAAIEADAIGDLTGRLPLRLHVVGDAKTDGAAKLLAEAAARHTAKHGQPAWAYTHGWMEDEDNPEWGKVKRESWGTVSILASVHTVQDAKEQMAQGYGAAIVYENDEHHPMARAAVVDGLKIVPCPAQVKPGCGCDQCVKRKKISCDTCRMCWKQPSTFAVGFEGHGPMSKTIKERSAPMIPSN